ERRARGAGARALAAGMALDARPRALAVVSRDAALPAIGRGRLGPGAGAAPGRPRRARALALRPAGTQELAGVPAPDRAAGDPPGDHAPRRDHGAALDVRAVQQH